MDKHVNFEDTIFILNSRMRMIHDLLRLNTDAELFLQQTLGDLEFIGSTLEMLTTKLLVNTKFLDRELEADSISDTEWQFSQLLAEFSKNQGPFSPNRFPETLPWITRLKKDSARRQKQIDESYVPSEHTSAESVVSQAELSELLGAV